jgi:hypothetical protein
MMPQNVALRVAVARKVFHKANLRQTTDLEFLLNDEFDGAIFVEFLLNDRTIIDHVP